mgnify:CR=1 FL=1
MPPMLRGECTRAVCGSSVTPASSLATTLTGADPAPTSPDVRETAHGLTRALNLLTRSGVPRQRFIELMSEARARTKEASSSIRKTVKKDGASFSVKAKMPFFFATLEDLCGVSPEPSNQMNHSGETS